MAYTHAAGPASYSISAPSLDHYSVGQSNEHTVKGLYGQNVLSTYSKAVHTPHSSVQVHNSKATNDILGHHGAAAYGYGGVPALGYGYAAHHGVAPALGYAGLGYHGLAAPAYATGIHGPYGPAGIAHAPLGAYHGAALAYPGAAYGPGLLKAAPIAAAGHVPVSSVSFHGLGAHYGW